MNALETLLHGLQQGSPVKVSPAEPTPVPATPEPPNGAAFAGALALLKGYEGGYGNDPRDAGNWTGGKCGVGECLGTNFGIASSAYKAGLALLDPKIAATFPKTVKGLTWEQAGQIYKVAYWDKVRGDELPPALAMVAFDGAVNSGPGRSVMWLQTAVGSKPDGGFGPNTMAAVKKAVAARGATAVALAMLDAREDFDRSLETWPIYGKGWLSRINNLRSHVPTFPAGVR